MASAIAGHEGRMVIQGVTFTAERWRVRSTATEVPANDFESRHRKSKGGLIGSEVEIFGYWDRDANPMVVHSVKAGFEGMAVTAFLIKGGLAFVFSTLNVFEVESSDEVDGRVEMTIRGKTSGAWTYPGGISPL